MYLIAGLTAICFGTMPTLEPGCGKSLIAAYAVGNRCNLRLFIVLGPSTAPVVLISAVTGALYFAK